VFYRVDAIFLGYLPTQDGQKRDLLFSPSIFRELFLSDFCWLIFRETTGKENFFKKKLDIVK
jgi:hypothetical protein